MEQRAENREHKSRLKSALHSKSKIQNPSPISPTRSAAFARGFFTFLESRQVRAAVPHGGKDESERELSDTGFVVGHRQSPWSDGGTKIGHRVYIEAGAKILGPVTIGDDAVVGANRILSR
jgi:hypothetical protein